MKKEHYAMGRRWEVNDKKLDSPFAEAIRKLSQESKCECGNILSEEEIENCGGLCFGCYEGHEFGDIYPDHPDKGERG